MTSLDKSDIKPTSSNLFDRTKVYGLEAVAKHFDVSLRQVQRWAKLPGFPKAPDRWYSLVAIGMWRDEHKASRGKQAGGEGEDLEKEGTPPREGTKKYWELENIKNQAKTRELEYRRRKGELVERREVDDLFVRRVMIVTQGLEALSRSLPPLLVNKSEREMEPMIAGRIRALRELFARPLPEKFDAEKPINEPSGEGEGKS